MSVFAKTPSSWTSWMCSISAPGLGSCVGKREGTPWSLFVSLSLPVSTHQQPLEPPSCTDQEQFREKQLYSVKALGCRKHASGGPIRSRGGWDYALTINCFQMSVSRPELLGSLPCASTTEPDLAVGFISPNS